MHLIRRCHRLLRDRSGLAMLEFALSLPIVLPMGLYAIELSNFGLSQLKISQVTLSLADNAARVGIDTNLATQQLRDVDINDILTGMRIQAGGLNLPANGRVTISSLETSGGNQWIHWQRCLGLKSGTGYDSSYGQEGDGKSPKSAITGMGDPDAMVIAPLGSAVIFVEINYDYTPLISNYFIGSRKMHQIASFIVRDNRDLIAGVTNPVPEEATRMTCDKHTV